MKSWIRLVLVVLSMTILPGCFTSLFSRPEAQNQEKEIKEDSSPKLRCDGSSLKYCESVKTDGPPRQSSKVSVIAADALVALRVCQAMHYEVVNCVRKYVARQEALQDPPKEK